MLTNPAAYRPHAPVFWRLAWLPFLLGTLAAVPKLAGLILERHWGATVEVLVFVAVWVPVFFVASWFSYGRPLLHWHLARSGVAARGVVRRVTHWPARVRGPRHHVRYSFVDSSGSMRHGLEFLPEERRDAFATGDALEVWHSPFSSRLSAPVALCQYGRGSATDGAQTKGIRVKGQR